MSPYETYQHHTACGWTRIEMLLALYDGAIQRLEQARDCLARNDSRSAAPLLVRAQRIVIELLAGLDLSYGDLPRNLQRLYAFALQAISTGTADRVAGAQQVLETLRDGLLQVRDEAVALERSGTVPPADSGRTLQAIC